MGYAIGGGEVPQITIVGYSDVYRTVSTVRTIELGSAQSITATFSAAAPMADTVSAPLDKLQAKASVSKAFVLSGVRFSQGGKDHVSKADGALQVDLSPVTGVGTRVGSLYGALGLVELTAWSAGSSPLITNWRGIEGPPVTGPFSPFGSSGITFRTAAAPLRPSSFSLLGKMRDETTFNVAADANGVINTPRVKGRINYEQGVVKLFFVSPAAQAGMPQADLTFLNIPGVAIVNLDLAQKDSLRYNAVAYSYLPLNAGLIGIEPTRLPSDGRVPIYRKGELVVLGHKRTTAAFAATNGQVKDLGRVRLSRVRVVGADKLPIVSGYTADLEAGTVKFTDVAGYAQPVTVEDRIEDMVLLGDAAIDGTLTGTAPLSHAYPVGSYVSSVLVPPGKDLRARVALLFDMLAWNRVAWTDEVQGDGAVAQYNDTLAPIVVTNAGALTERWALYFTSNSKVQVIGEHLGVIGEYSINADIAPLNPIANFPYFLVRDIGFGLGWIPGNTIRFNTVGAMGSFGVARCIQQGPATVQDDQFGLLIRGNVDRP